MRDVYKEITDTIISGMETALKWEKPWRPNVGNTGKLMTRPVNVQGKPYHGINVPVLWSAAIRKGYTDSTWGTYRAWLAAGGQVRAGERATQVVFWKKVERTKTGDNGEEIDDSFMTARAYAVFNSQQVDNWKAAPVVELPETERNQRAESFVAATKANIRIVPGSDRAFYSPSFDSIQIPHQSQFTDAGAYWATLAHELTHWSGHPSRCAREFGKRFGDSAYAFEELVAEMGAAFICSDLGISAEPRADHASYLKEWLSILRADKRAIFTAASKAESACRFLHAFSGEGDPDEGSSSVTESPLPEPVAAPIVEPVTVEPVPAPTINPTMPAGGWPEPQLPKPMVSPTAPAMPPAPSKPSRNLPKPRTVHGVTIQPKHHWSRWYAATVRSYMAPESDSNRTRDDYAATAIEYCRWLAMRDGIEIPKGAYLGTVWSGDYIKGCDVRIGREILFTIPIPNYNWVPTISYREEREAA